MTTSKIDRCFETIKTVIYWLLTANVIYFLTKAKFELAGFNLLSMILIRIGEAIDLLELIANNQTASRINLQCSEGKLVVSSNTEET